MARLKTVILLLTFSLTLPAGSVQAWPLDHRLNYNNSGFWAHNVQTDMIDVLVVGEIAAGLWVGGETRFGKTDWQAIDSTAAGAILAQTGKFIFTRSRPSQTDNPNLWFKGKGNYSFPSGEVTTVTSIVTPFILEYGHDYPAVYALTLLPVYTGVARMKNWGHWQTDVIASWALGAGTGYFAHSLETPFILSWLPHGVMVGWHTQF
jgi:membrane-associated phospholipid phosphatase